METFKEYHTKKLQELREKAYWLKFYIDKLHFQCEQEPSQETDLLIISFNEILNNINTMNLFDYNRLDYLYELHKKTVHWALQVNYIKGFVPDARQDLVELFDQSTEVFSILFTPKFKVLERIESQFNDTITSLNFFLRELTQTDNIESTFNLHGQDFMEHLFRLFQVINTENDTLQIISKGIIEFYDIINAALSLTSSVWSLANLDEPLSNKVDSFARKQTEDEYWPHKLEGTGIQIAGQILDSYSGDVDISRALNQSIALAFQDTDIKHELVEVRKNMVHPVALKLFSGLNHPVDYTTEENIYG